MDDQRAGPPAVLPWFKVYCGFLVVLYLVIGLLCLTGLLVPSAELDSSELPAWMFYAMVGAMAGGSVMFSGAFAAGILLGPKPWV